MNYSSYTTDCVKFISIIMQTLRGTASPVWSCIGIISPHCAVFCPCVLADLYRLRVDAEHILVAVYGHCYILSNFFGKAGCQLAAGIELSAADQIGQVFPALMVQTMKQEILTVDAESLSRYAESYDLKVGKLETTPHRGIFPCSFTRFAAKSLQIPKILTNFAMKLHIGRAIAVNSLTTTNLLNLSNMCNFSICIYLEF